MPRGKAVPVPIREEIYRLVRMEGITNAAAIHRYLAERYQDVPHERTIRNIVRELAPPDPSEPWNPSTEDDPQEVALILEVLAEASCDGWGDLEITQDLAEVIGWLRRGWPDLDPRSTFLIAHEIRARSLGKENDMGDILMFLGMAPWRSSDRLCRWLEAMDAGLIPKPPFLFLMSVMPEDPPARALEFRVVKEAIEMMRQWEEKVGVAKAGKNKKRRERDATAPQGAR